MSFEIRTLTIRNNSIPPRRTLSEIWKLYPKDYISFQNNQIIQVSEALESLPKVFEEIERERREYQDPNTLHIMQTITLVGNSDGFWDREARVLYITFLQTKDFVPDSDFPTNRYEQLVEGIHKFYIEKNENVDFALYYSYDFCDYVLFVKDAAVKLHNDLVWQLTMSDDPCFLCLRDSYTFYTLQNSSLLEEGKQEHSPQQGRKVMSLAVRMSVYSSAALSAFLEGLKKEELQLSDSSILGRYDIELRTD